MALAQRRADASAINIFSLISFGFQLDRSLSEILFKFQIPFLNLHQHQADSASIPLLRQSRSLAVIVKRHHVRNNHNRVQ